MSKLKYSALVSAAIFAVLLFPACSRQARKARYIGKADRDFEAGQYDAAEVEYLNAARIDQKDPHVVGRLGIIYFEEGLVQRSFNLLTAAERLAPDDLEVRKDVGLYLLALGKTEAARDEAIYILQRDPNSVDAPLLLAESATRAEDIDAARRRLQQLPVSVRDGAPVLTALGNLQYRQKQYAEAETLFQQALRADPRYANACTGLAALYWQEKDFAKAGEFFAKAAELSSLRSAKRLQFAQFKIQTGDLAGGRKILEDIIQKAPDFLSPNMLLAKLDEREGKLDEAEAADSKVLARDPLYPDAMAYSGRLKLAKNEPAKAVTIFEKARSYFPRNPALEYELAQAYLGSGAADKAAAVLNSLLTWAPDFAEAGIALAEIDIQKGDWSAAIVVLKQMVQRRPEVIQARVLLANAYVGNGDLEDALAFYRQFAEAAPKDPQPLTAMGAVLLQQNKGAEARAAFEQALKLDPTYPAAIERLVTLDLMEKRYADALALLEGRIAKDPSQAQNYLLLARTYLAQRDMQGAEVALKKTIELQPNSTQAYSLLVALYVTTKEDTQARAALQKVTAENPRDAKNLLLMGMIEFQQKDYAAARAAYEKALAVDPNLGKALNNLAYLYAEYFGEQDKAFEMVQQARKLLPNEPLVADTMGWILYKKRQFAWALSLLKEAEAGLPGDGEIQYHLGMTQYILGQESAARATLEHALGSGGNFPGADQVRERLSVLATDVVTAGAPERAALEKYVAGHGDDPIALTRLAALYERNGAVDKAIAACEAAVKADPKAVAALAELARLYAARGENAKAFELGKSAHNLAPDDPGVSHVLGLLAYRMGDYAWAASLLGDTAVREPNDPEALFDLGQANYSLGRVAEAEGDMRRAIAADAGFAHAAMARRFLGFVGLPDHPRQAVAAAAEANRVLAAEPDDVPSLMVRGTVLQENGDSAGAIRTFETVLAHFAKFTPAEKKLAFLYAAHPEGEQKAFQAALHAREAFPDDKAVVKACGIIEYRHGNFRGAEELLGKAAKSALDDGEVVFYLGMAQYHLKEKNCKDNLERALGLKLREDLAAEARRTLAELKP